MHNAAAVKPYCKNCPIIATLAGSKTSLTTMVLLKHWQCWLDRPLELQHWRTFIFKQVWIIVFSFSFADWIQFSFIFFFKFNTNTSLPKKTFSIVTMLISAKKILFEKWNIISFSWFKTIYCDWTWFGQKIYFISEKHFNLLTLLSQQNILEIRISATFGKSFILKAVKSCVL